ncbi:MAG: hypothetical protein V4643_08050 [Bacteroidota bacterium]
MKNLSPATHAIHAVSNFEALVAIPFQGDRNAIGWTRELRGDFAEIVNQVALNGNITELDEETLLDMQLSEQGQLAREILLNDLKLLKAYGASPSLNIIKCYERDDENPFFPTDVYSFHVDRSPVPTDTFLCTYYGEPSEIVPNAQAEQKVLVPEIREELKKGYGGADEGFELFLREHFLDLHYHAKPGASPVSLGIGNLWRLSVDHPESTVLPCIHRAPKEKTGQHRLLLIC